MFSKRLSTFSLFCVALIAGLPCFLIGRLSVHRPEGTSQHTVTSPVDVRPKDFYAASASVTRDASSMELQSAEVDWATLSARPRTPAAEGDMVAFIEKLAETDPAGRSAGV